MFYTSEGNSKKNLYKDENGQVWVKINDSWERAVETFIYILPVWTLKKDPVLKLVCPQDMMRAKISGVPEEKIYEFVEASVKTFHDCGLSRMLKTMSKVSFRKELVDKMKEINIDIEKKGITNDWIPNYKNYLQ